MEAKNINSKKERRQVEALKCQKYFLLHQNKKIHLVFKSMIRERFMIDNEKIKMIMRIKMLLNQKFRWPIGT